MHHKPRLNRREARDYLATAHGIDYSIKYFGKITRDGTGPRVIYNGTRALYEVADLDAWAYSRLWEPERRHHLDQPTPEQMEIAWAQSAEFLDAARGFVMAEIERAKAGEPAPGGLGWGDDDFHPIMTAFRASACGPDMGGVPPLTNAEARAIASAEDVQQAAELYGVPLAALIAEATRKGPCTRGDVEGIAACFRLGARIGYSLIGFMHPDAVAEVTRDKTGELQ